MPKIYTVAGQVSPSADTDTVLYTVAANKQFVGSTLNICNRAATTANYSVAVVPSGETLGDKHYVCFGKELAANDYKNLTMGLTIKAGDKVYVRSSTATLSFSLFGAEYF